MSQKDPDRATLDAFVDGELPASEMTRIAALVAQRADLRTYVEKQERLRQTLQESFVHVMHEPISERLRQTVQAATISRPRGASWGNGLREIFTWRALRPAAAALAFGLVVGIAVDRFGLSGDALLQSTADGQTVARGELAHVLSEQLAAAQNPAEAIRVGLSFRNKGGRDCRTFEWDGAKNSLSGIACRSAGEWVVPTWTTAVPNAHAQAPYQMAGAGMPDAIRTSVQEMISGAPFDASAERAARRAHWSGATPR